MINEERSPQSDFFQPLYSLLKNVGDEITQMYHSCHYEVSCKEDRSFVTSADIYSHNTIVDFLLKEYSYPVISEEQKNKGLGSEYTWIIDPIDGTNGFIKKTDEFAIMLSLVFQMKPLIGMVYLPIQKKLYFAEKSQGCYLITEKTSQRLFCHKKKVSVAILSRGRKAIKEKNFLKEKGIKEHIYCSSMGVKTGLICENKADIYVNFASKLYIWDIIPNDILITEAQGSMTDTQGKKLDYTQGSNYITNGCIISTSSPFLNIEEE